MSLPSLEHSFSRQTVSKGQGEHVVGGRRRWGGRGQAGRAKLAFMAKWPAVLVPSCRACVERLSFHVHLQPDPSLGLQTPVPKVLLLSSHGTSHWCFQLHLSSNCFLTLPQNLFLLYFLVSGNGNSALPVTQVKTLRVLFLSQTTPKPLAHSVYSGFTICAKPGCLSALLLPSFLMWVSVKASWLAPLAHPPLPPSHLSSQSPQGRSFQSLSWHVSCYCPVSTEYSTASLALCSMACFLSDLIFCYLVHAHASLTTLISLLLLKYTRYGATSGSLYFLLFARKALCLNTCRAINKLIQVFLQMAW